MDRWVSEVYPKVCPSKKYLVMSRLSLSWPAATAYWNPRAHRRQVTFHDYASNFVECAPPTLGEHLYYWFRRTFFHYG